MKLVTGSQAAQEKQVEIRLERSEYGGPNDLDVRMYEGGVAVRDGRLGRFMLRDNKIDFAPAARINPAYVHLTTRPGDFQPRLKCV